MLRDECVLRNRAWTVIGLFYGVSDSVGSSAPSIPVEDTVSAKIKPQGSSFAVPCSAQAYPPPQYRYSQSCNLV